MFLPNPAKRSAYAIISKNEMLPCKVPSCSNHRYRLSPFCSSHYTKHISFGDAQGQALSPKLWDWERQHLRQLFQENQHHHPGLIHTLQFLDAWMKQATTEDNKLALSGRTVPPEPVKWCPEIARLVRHGVTPLDLLVELAACWSWLQRFPHRAPSDRAVWFALSRAVFSLAPRPVRASRSVAAQNHPQPSRRGNAVKPVPKALEQVGKHLSGSLAPLLVNAYQTLHTEQDKAMEVVQAMRQPFVAPAVAVTKAAAIAA